MKLQLLSQDVNSELERGMYSCLPMTDFHVYNHSYSLLALTYLMHPPVCRDDGHHGVIPTGHVGYRAF